MCSFFILLWMLKLKSRKDIYSYQRGGRAAKKRFSSKCWESLDRIRWPSLRITRRFSTRAFIVRWKCSRLAKCKCRWCNWKTGYCARFSHSVFEIETWRDKGEIELKDWRGYWCCRVRRWLWRTSTIDTGVALWRGEKIVWYSCWVNSSRARRYWFSWR